MSEPQQRFLDAEAFVAWAMAQPIGRFELVDGEVVRMASERATHARVKWRTVRRLEDAVDAAGLACEVFGDGMAVRVDHATVCEPDAVLRCGEPVDGETVFVLDPVIVPEVASPSSASVDTGAKLAGYFRISSVWRYLIVRTKDQTVIQHSRATEGTILTRIIRDGAVRLEPPGIEIAGLF